MDTSEAELDQFSTKGCEEVLKGLLVNIQHLISMRNHVQMGNLKFESLCHGVASSLQEMGLRLTKLSEEDKNLREDVLLCRKNLLACASIIVLNAKHPFKTFPFFDGIVQVCQESLKITEMGAKRKAVLASVPTLESLEILEKSASYKNLFLNIKIFGSKLHVFLELAATICGELKSEKCRGDLIARAETIKKLLPLVIQSLRESLRHPMNSHTRSSREFFFGVVRNAIAEMVQSIHDSDQTNNEIGLFIMKLDSALEITEKIENLDQFADLNDDIEWLIKFSLSVGKVSKPKDNKDILGIGHNLVKELMNVKKALELEGPSKDLSLAKDVAREIIEELEQTVNNALLKLIIDCFCSVATPLDELIHHVLNSTVSPPDRLPDDIDDLVSGFDDRADNLFHIAHFTTFCTTDAKRSLAIHTCLHLLQELEKEVVPAVFKLYFNPEDHGARAHLKALRSLWSQTVEQLETHVMGIVDATAFCYVINEEVRAVSGIIKKEQYRQDRKWIHLAGTKLIRMCQRAVDFAWKDCSQSTEDPLPDDHPIVKVERSTWELQAALRLVLESIEDLNLHKTMIRRVQVLATCLGIMSHYLVNKNESVLSASKVRVLTSVSRITISKESMVVKEESDQSKANNGSRLSGLSFRSVKRKESLLRTRNIDSDVERCVNESLAKLKGDSSALIPFQTRKMLNDTGLKPVKKSGFDFTEIFDQLSALSQDIATTLEKDQNLVKSDPPKVKKSTHADVSLRQIAFKNAASKEPLKLYSEDTSNVKIIASNHGIGSPERLKDIKKVNEKLEKIKTTL